MSAGGRGMQPWGGGVLSMCQLPQFACGVCCFSACSSGMCSYRAACCMSPLVTRAWCLPVPVCNVCVCKQPLKRPTQAATQGLTLTICMTRVYLQVAA